MTEPVIPSTRYRAWILVQSGSPYDDARLLYDSNLMFDGGDGWVVVRADVVDFEYNIVIPVDAESPDALRVVLHRLVDLINPRQIAVLPVMASFPPVPHDANGFITDSEAAAGTDKVLGVGRIHNSPGANAWG